MSKFKIGDKVVCIETDQQECDSNGIVYGMTYVVEHIDEYGPEEEWLLYFGNTSAFAKRFKLAEEQVLSNAFNKVVKEVDETFVAKSLIEKGTEMTAEQIREEILRIDVRIEEAKKDTENAEKERNSLVEKLREKGFTLVGEISQVASDKPFLEIGATYVVNDSDSANTYFMIGTKVTLVDTDEGSSLDVLVKRGDGERDWMNSNGLTKI